MSVVINAKPKKLDWFKNDDGSEYCNIGSGYGWLKVEKNINSGDWYITEMNMNLLPLHLFNINIPREQYSSVEIAKKACQTTYDFFWTSISVVTIDYHNGE